MEDLWARFQRWRSALEGKGLRVNIGKTKLMVNGTENAIALSRIEPCGIRGKKLCLTQCIAHRVTNECMGDAPK